MKKILSILLIGALVSSLICVGVSAANNNEKQDVLSVEEYANLDLKDVMDTEIREKVLDARKKIIFDNEWVADGYTGYVMDITTGEKIRDLPAFSEVFPGWELPVEEITVNKQPTEAEPFVILSENATRVSSSDWIYVGGTNYYLTQATDTITTPYAYFYWDPYNIGTTIATYASMLTSSETCNIGYTNMSTGQSISYATDLTLNEACVIMGMGKFDLGIRASTFSLPGWSTLETIAADRLILVK